MRLIYIIPTVLAFVACSTCPESETASAAASSGNPPSVAPCAGQCPLEVPADADRSLCRYQLCDPDTNGCDVYVYFPGEPCNQGTGVCDDAGSCNTP
jgi:hypothetical protein